MYIYQWRFLRECNACIACVEFLLQETKMLETPNVHRKPFLIPSHAKEQLSMTEPSLPIQWFPFLISGTGK